MAKVDLSFSKNGNAGIIKVGDKVDQAVIFPEMADFEGVEQLVIDFGSVQLINSLGVKEFLNFLKFLHEIPNIHIFYEDCTPLVVKQMSMLPEFVHGVVIRSVRGPLYCENCDLEAEISIIIGDKTLAEIEPLTQGNVCKECEGELEFDEPIRSYFFFLEA